MGLSAVEQPLLGGVGADVVVSCAGQSEFVMESKCCGMGMCGLCC